MALSVIWLSKGLFKIWSIGSFLSDKMVLFLFCVYVWLTAEGELSLKEMKCKSTKFEAVVTRS